MKLKRGILLSVVVMVISAVIYFLVGVNTETNQDLRIAYIDDGGIVLKSISNQRRMVNIARVNADVSVWIPGGLGWYEAGKIKKLLEQENKRTLGKDIMFFNFGFNPNIVKYSSEESAQDWWQMGKVWGWGNFFKYSLKGNGGLMTKEERITGQLAAERDFLTTIMQRDFADSQVIEEGIKASVYNRGNANGLAGTVARNLEWAGLTVYGVESVNQENGSDKCQLIFGDKVKETKTGELLKSVFPGCIETTDPLLTDKEVELYLTDKYAEMINYQSYNTN